MNRVKYIVIMKGGLERPYVFGELDTHREVAVAMLHDRINWNSADPFTLVMGAGFCHREEVERGVFTWKCYGGSTSLKIESRGQRDEKVLNSHLEGA